MFLLFQAEYEVTLDEKRNNFGKQLINKYLTSQVFKHSFILFTSFLIWLSKLNYKKRG